MYRVCLVLFPEFQMLAYVLATETLRVANKSAGRDVYLWETRCVNHRAACASNGALVEPDRADWGDAEKFHLVLLCAGYNPLRHLPTGLRAFLSRAERAGATLGGVDTGSVVLAKLGFLAGYEAVLHYEAEAAFRETWPEIAVSDNIYCIDDKRLTAAGGMATGDAMLSWIEQTQSSELAAATSDAMAHGKIRGGRERQRLARSNDPLMIAMQQIMNSNLSAPLPLSSIARRLGQSPKQLRGRCLKALRATPISIYLQLRLQYSLDLVRGTEMPITEIALATGFGSLSGFTRTFRQFFKVTPRGLRYAIVQAERERQLDF